ncbi:folate-binding protein [Pelagibacteraceae bacterium]|nr:folate-binding protein [Pelagibacteraceae bacterium]
MEKNQITILEDRGLICISGPDAKDFLQNILSNDVNKVSQSNSICSAIFSPQGKYLYEFFLIKTKNGYFLDCDNELTEEIISHLSKYKLSSNIEIKDLSSSYVAGVINLDKFKELQKLEKTNNETLFFRENIFYIDPRNSNLGARILSNLEKLYLTIKRLNLQVVNNRDYLNQAHLNGVPIKGTKYLKNQLFGLEANFEQLNLIDFKKGCYVGQENTARMKLKNKIRRRLMAIKTEENLIIGDELTFNDKVVGKVLINKPYVFALIKLFDPEYNLFKNEDIFVDGKKVKIINNF